MKNKKIRSRESGFTLIELLVVVLIIGILAAIAVPQYFKVVEKGKAAEATQWLGQLADAEEHYLAAQGNYCTSVTPAGCSFDTGIPTSLKYFNAAVTINAGPGGANCTVGSPDWTITLQRVAPYPAYYTGYAIVYDHCGQNDPYTGKVVTMECAGGGNPAACDSDLVGNR